MMKIALSILGVLVGIFVLLAIFAPRDFSLSREIVVNKPRSQVFYHVKFLKNHEFWNAWTKLDPNIAKTFQGTDGAVGFKASWDSPVADLGTAEQEITGIVEGERLDTVIRFKKPFEADFDSYLTLADAAEGQTKVTMGMADQMPFPMYVFSFIYNKCLGNEGKLTNKMDESLASMKSFLETMPNEATKVEVTRLVNAPREKVWKAWTEVESLKRWWGPEHFTAPFIKNDLRVGKNYIYCMASPDGQEFCSTGTYKEIVPNEKIVATDSFSNREGKIIPASELGMKDEWPAEVQVTVTFADVEGKTQIRVEQVGIPGAMIQMAQMGWAQSLNKFEKNLK